MSCRIVDLGGGVTAITCGPRRSAKKCAFCKVDEAVYACDAPLRGPKLGQVCDGAMCKQCATQVGPNEHLCPPHKRERDKLDEWARETFGDTAALIDAQKENSQ